MPSTSHLVPIHETIAHLPSDQALRLDVAELIRDKIPDFLDTLEAGRLRGWDLMLLELWGLEPTGWALPGRDRWLLLLAARDLTPPDPEVPGLELVSAIVGPSSSAMFDPWVTGKVELTYNCWKSKDERVRKLTESPSNVNSTTGCHGRRRCFAMVYNGYWLTTTK